MIASLTVYLKHSLQELTDLLEQAVSQEDYEKSSSNKRRNFKKRVLTK
jgi:hypothetical protein